MARRVFFSFHYERDLWRVNVVRNSGLIEGVSAAGFHDASLWEEAKRHGDGTVKRMIDVGLESTTVTVVLIGLQTSARRYVSYEISQSIARGNGLLGIRIHQVRNREGATDQPGEVPSQLLQVGAPIYTWEYGKLGVWVASAFEMTTRKT
jgi:MTH538 TIR-like domain (DUF1863)